MKKIILTALFLSATGIAGFCQFSDKGYKDLKLGMTLPQAQKVTSFKLDNDQMATINYDGIRLQLQFTELENGLLLYSISSESSNAKVVNVLSELIGKTRQQVQGILGAKMKPFEGSDEGGSVNYFLYFKDKAAEKNQLTSCVLYFNDKGILASISAAHNP